VGRAGTDELPEVLAGRYTVGDRLARGGMGEVRAGHDQRLGRDVAVKFLHPELVERDDARRRFDIEARAAARLVHPNVVTVYDCGEDGDVPYLVMERLPGRTLRDELADGPMPVGRACELAAEILAALQAAHDAGILHRDVKPGNVLLTDDGHAKVTDFGIAKLTEAADRTLTTELLATPVYLAPERFGGAPATRRSDLYSVGVVLYEALAGQRPFEGRSAAEVFGAMQRGDAPPLTAVRDDVPAAIAAAVGRAMAPDPARRFGSADEMAQALGVDTGARNAERAARDEVTVSLGAVPPTIEVQPPPRTVGAPDAPPARPRPTRTRRVVAVIAGALLAAAIAVAVLLTRDDGLDAPDAVTDTTVATTPAALPSAVERELPEPLERAVDELERLTAR
jgi:serine/threonine protein kinase